MALTKKLIMQLFSEIDEELRLIDQQADLFMIGGAAMTVVYDARPSTKDIDGIFQPSQPLRLIIKKIAARHGLDEDWMYDAAKGAISQVKETNPIVVFDGEFFSVSTPSVQYLLATKMLASRRDRDDSDIKLLVKECGFSTSQQCLDVVQKYYPTWVIEPKTQYLIEELITEMNRD